MRKTIHFEIFLITLVPFLGSGCGKSMDCKNAGPLFREIYANLGFSSSNKIRNAVFDGNQMRLYTESFLESALIRDEVSVTGIDPAFLEKARIDSLKSKSLGYFRFFVGMKKAERSCYDSELPDGISGFPDAMAALKTYLLKRNECLFEMTGKGRLDSLFKARPELVENRQDCEMNPCPFDAKAEFLKNPERILEILNTDEKNETTKRSWEQIKSNSKFTVSDTVRKDEFLSDAKKVVAYREGNAFIDMAELRMVLKASPLDSSYIDRLRDYVEIVGIWKLGAEAYDSSGLVKSPAARNFVKQKADEFYLGAFRETYFQSQEVQSRKRMNARFSRPWDSLIAPCRELASVFSPRGYFLIGNLPDTLFYATLLARMAGSDTAAPFAKRCIQYLESANDDAYEISKNALLSDLKSKHAGTYERFRPFLAVRKDFSDSMAFAQGEYERGNAAAAEAYLRGFCLRYFSDEKKFTSLSILLARISLERGRPGDAVFYLERNLLLFPADASLDIPLRLLIAVYQREFNASPRALYWKKRYAGVIEFEPSSQVAVTPVETARDR